MGLQAGWISLISSARGCLWPGLTAGYLNKSISDLSLTYLDSADFITVTVPAHAMVQHTFVFTATETGRASVALSFTPQPGEAGQRTLMIDSLPVQVVDPAPGAYLTFDQAIYEPGQTIHLTAHVLDPASHVIVQGPEELLINGETLALSLIHI